MKKLLALVLALVMTLGLATVGANAAYKDFPDTADVNYEEAMKVMTAVGVFAGKDGKLAPQDNLTRAEAAKLIAYLDLGEDTAEALAPAQIFSDVPATHWASKYVAYCQQAGIIQGGNGVFMPDDPLTGYAFGAYLLAVLGYDRNLEGMTGANWQIATAKLMANNGIGDGVDKNGSVTMTREEAAQYCLEALSADVVRYDTKGTTVAIGGATVTTSASTAETITGVNYVNAFANDGHTTVLQLGEKLYKGQLVKTADTNDTWGNDATSWKYKASSIGTFTDEADKEYTEKVTYGDLYDLLGSTVLSASNRGVYEFYRDGMLVANNDAADNTTGFFTVANVARNSNTALGYTETPTGGADDQQPTGNGVLTKVYFAYNTTTKKYDVTITTVTTYLAKTTSDYNASNESIYIEVYNNNITTTKLEAKDFSAIKDMTKDTFFYVTAQAGDSVNPKNQAGIDSYAIKTIKAVPAENMVIDAVVSGYTAQKTVTAGGTAYKYAYANTYAGAAGKALYDTPANYTLNSGSYDLILDQYGYVLGQKTHSTGSNAGEYLYLISAAATDGGDGNALEVRARAKFMDGTTEAIYVNSLTATTGTKYTLYGTNAISATVGAGYTATTANQVAPQHFYKFVKRSDGTYDLTAIAQAAKDNAATTRATQGRYDNVAVSSDVTPINTNNTDVASANTVLVVGSKVYTGVKNFPTVAAGPVHWVMDNENPTRILVMYATGNVTNSGSSSFVYLYGNQSKRADGDTVYWDYAAVKNGEKVTIAADSSSGGKGAGIYDISTTDKDGAVTLGGAATPVNNQYKWTANTNDAAGNLYVADGIITVNKTPASSYSLTDDVVFYYIDGTDADASVDVVSAAYVSNLDTDTYDYNVYGFSATASASDSAAKIVYVVKAGAA